MLNFRTQWRYSMACYITHTALRVNLQISRSPVSRDRCWQHWNTLAVERVTRLQTAVDTLYRTWPLISRNYTA